ncbi:16S rRNA (cytosine(1402)-N(4))-methyltransferase, partial [bacterium G20]
AGEIVNTANEAQLASILREFGEERKSRQIAKNIVTKRPIHTTDQLAAIVASSYRFRSRIHPATKTFQALRIAVNDELAQLASSLPLMLQLLTPSGRLAIISFHSLEDRLVKQTLKDAAGQGYEAEVYLLNKKPITAHPDEIVLNPRARSAKLRAVAKIKNAPKIS